MRDERVDVLKAQRGGGRDGGRCSIWWGRDEKDVPFGGGRDAEDVPFVTSPLSLTRIFRLVKVLTEILRALGF